MRRAARGFLRRFKTDLTTHDAALLARTPRWQRFFWALRPDGTCLYCLPYRDRQRRTGADIVRCVDEAFGHLPIRWYGWDGAALRRFGSVDEAATFAAAQIDMHVTREGAAVRFGLQSAAAQRWARDTRLDRAVASYGDDLVVNDPAAAAALVQRALNAGLAVS